YYPRATIQSGVYADPAADRASAQRYAVNDLTRDGNPPTFDAEQFAAALTRERFDAVAISRPVTTLSAVIAAHRIGRIDLLKIDAERSEWDVLVGIEEADWPKIGQVVLEVHDGAEAVGRITDLLAARGFAVAVEQDPAFSGTDVYSVYAT